MVTSQQAPSAARFSLGGKVAIVTGGSRGIGRAIALGFAEAGAAVVVAARGAADLAETADAIAERNGAALTVETDIADSAGLVPLVKRAGEWRGRVDILVNNAAISSPGPITTVDDAAWEAVMAANVRAAFRLSTLVHLWMKAAGGGSIINVGSIAGVRPFRALAAYSVSKAALAMLTRVCAAEWGADGIRVNCLAPGLIQTEFSRPLWDGDDRRRAVIAGTPLGRLGTPDDLVGTALLLASDAGAYITAQTLVVDGGRTGV
jgi:NAD(P)-dependent dehydrogenase (short-subunit alcohol dehydrogenase family)